MHTCCRRLRRAAYQSSVAEDEAVSLPREAGTHVPGIFVVVTNFVGERKCAQRAAVAAGAARGVAVMLQSSVAITAVIDELILTREGGETRRLTDASPLTALPSDSARASAPWKPS